MNATRWMASLAMVLGLGLFCMNGTPLSAQEAAAGGTAQQKYTMPEYNMYIAAQNEKNAAAQVKALDDFVAKYPNSSLLNYVYPLYYQNYAGQKNYAKVIEYAEKELALGDKISATERYQAYQAIAFAFNNTQNPDAATAKKAYQAALDGAKSVDGLSKPEGYDDAKWAAEKEKGVMSFYTTAGNAAMVAKDYASAAQVFKNILAKNPDDFIANYNLGRAYSATTPPQQLDAIWAYARAATSKNANEQQSKQVKAYIPKVIANYQGGTVCDSVSQAELNELLQLAGSSADRPATYKLPGADDLKAARESMTIASVVTDLKAGGDKAKLTWTAACGLEFPEVPSKVLVVTAGTDAVTIKAAFVTSDAEFEAATTPNMEFKVAGQPEAGKLEKDAFVHITGTLDSCDPDPAFMMHWSKGSVKADELPKEKAAPKKPAPRKPAPKKPQ